MTTHRYRCEIDLSADNSLTRVIRLVGARRRVLELGCATGYLSKALVERCGCTVTGIEVDAEAAEEARKVCSRLIIGDLDTLDLRGELGDERFEVIICADILEHLRDPVRVLRTLRDFLSPAGYVVASIPNIAHVSVVAELLQGRFGYRPLGLLDESHLRFFTRDSIYDCFEQAGFVISHLERIRLEPEDTEFRTDLSRFPPEFQKLLRSHEESTTYQFVLTAHPAAANGAADTLKQAFADAEVARRRGTDPRPREARARPGSPPDRDDEARYWRSRVEAFFEAMLARMTFLEEERARRSGDLAELRGHVVQLEGELERHAAHIRHLEHELRQTHQQVADREDGLRTLEAHLAALQTGLGWTVLQRYRRLKARLLRADSAVERAYARLTRAAARRFGDRR